MFSSGLRDKLKKNSEIGEKNIEHVLEKVGPYFDSFSAVIFCVFSEPCCNPLIRIDRKSVV